MIDLESDITIEWHFISSCLYSKGEHLTVNVSPADFYDVNCRKAWTSMLSMEKVTPDSVAAKISNVDFISDVMGRMPSFGEVEGLAKKIVENAKVRRIANMYERAAKAITTGTKDISEINEFVLRSIDDAPEDSEPVSIWDAAMEAYRGVEDAQVNGVRKNLVKTGFSTIDDGRIGGLQRNGLIVVAGRPSMGKTAQALGMALNIARDIAPSYIISLEMKARELAMRAMASMCGIDMQKMIDGRLSREDWSKLAGAVTALEGIGLFINDSTGGRNITSIIAEMRRFKRAHGNVGAFFIDYLSLIEYDNYHANVAISDITRRLKLEAEALNTPVVLLSQLNRKLEDRPLADRRPRCSDLRDSGAIEQDADQIIFIFRPEVYDMSSSDIAGYAEWIIAKNRNGPVGICKLRFDKRSASFADDATMSHIKWPARGGSDVS